MEESPSLEPDIFSPGQGTRRFITLFTRSTLLLIQ